MNCGRDHEKEVLLSPRGGVASHHSDRGLMESLVPVLPLAEQATISMGRVIGTMSPMSTMLIMMVTGRRMETEIFQEQKQLHRWEILGNGFHILSSSPSVYMVVMSQSLGNLLHPFEPPTGLFGPLLGPPQPTAHPASQTTLLHRPRDATAGRGRDWRGALFGVAEVHVLDSPQVLARQEPARTEPDPGQIRTDAGQPAGPPAKEGMGEGNLRNGRRGPGPFEFIPRFPLSGGKISGKTKRTSELHIGHEGSRIATLLSHTQLYTVCIELEILIFQPTCFRKRLITPFSERSSPQLTIILFTVHPGHHPRSAEPLCRPPLHQAPPPGASPIDKPLAIWATTEPGASLSQQTRRKKNNATWHSSCTKTPSCFF